MNYHFLEITNHTRNEKRVSYYPGTALQFAKVHALGLYEIRRGDRPGVYVLWDSFAKAAAFTIRQTR